MLIGENFLRNICGSGIIENNTKRHGQRKNAVRMSPFVFESNCKFAFLLGK